MPPSFCVVTSLDRGNDGRGVVIRRLKELSGCTEIIWTHFFSYLSNPENLWLKCHNSTILRKYASELTQSLLAQIFPFAWKQALVQPIPKKGDRSNLSNYFPIALTSATSKIFDSPKLTFSGIQNSHYLFSDHHLILQC